MGSKYQQEILKLTKKEREVYSIFSQGPTTPQIVAEALKCSKSYIYRVIRKLRIAGMMKPGSFMVHTPPGTTPKVNKTERIRLHGLIVKAKILYKKESYLSRLKRSNLVEVQGFKIQLFDSLVVFHSLNSFYGIIPAVAMQAACSSLNQAIGKLEQDFKIILRKERNQNFKICRTHFSEIDNEFASQAINEKARVQIRTLDDGKVWLTMDDSYNLSELETVHPETAQLDMQDAVLPHLQDWRENRPPTNSQIMSLIESVLVMQKEQAAGLTSIIKLIAPAEQQQPEKVDSRDRPAYVG